MSRIGRKAKNKLKSRKQWVEQVAGSSKYAAKKIRAMKDPLKLTTVEMLRLVKGTRAVEFGS